MDRYEHQIDHRQQAAPTSQLKNEESVESQPRSKSGDGISLPRFFECFKKGQAFGQRVGQFHNSIIGDRMDGRRHQLRQTWPLSKRTPSTHPTYRTVWPHVEMSTELIPFTLLPALLTSRRKGTQNMHIRRTDQSACPGSHHRRTRTAKARNPIHAPEGIRIFKSMILKGIGFLNPGELQNIQRGNPASRRPGMGWKKLQPSSHPAQDVVVSQAVVT